VQEKNSTDIVVKSIDKERTEGIFVDYKDNNKYAKSKEAQ
jgi:hypothetical protein